MSVAVPVAKLVFTSHINTGFHELELHLIRRFAQDGGSTHANFTKGQAAACQVGSQILMHKNRL